MPLFGCIADDFTGASDVASFLVQGGLRTCLFNGIPSAAPPAAAYHSAFFRSMPHRSFYGQYAALRTKL